jgi:hypothetical protein
MPNYLGTATGNTGIPTLLISTLQQVTDPNVQKALYQIQNWANSFVPLAKVPAVGTPLAGSFPTSYSPSVIGGVKSIPFSAGGGTLTFDQPFTTVLQSFVAMIGDATPHVDTLTWGSPFLTQISLAATIAGSPPTSTLTVSYIAIGQ